MPGKNLERDRVRMRRLAVRHAHARQERKYLAEAMDEAKSAAFTRVWQIVQNKRVDYPRQLQAWEDHQATPVPSLFWPAMKTVLGIGILIFGWLLLLTPDQTSLRALCGSMLIFAGAWPVRVGVNSFLYRDATRPRGERPTPPKFTRLECRMWMSCQGQGTDQFTFSAFSECPGCRTVAAHLIRPPEPVDLDHLDRNDPATWWGDPDWPDVIRQCGTCQFEWGEE